MLFQEVLVTMCQQLKENVCSICLRACGGLQWYERGIMPGHLSNRCARPCESREKREGTYFGFLHVWLHSVENMSHGFLYEREKDFYMEGLNSNSLHGEPERCAPPSLKRNCPRRLAEWHRTNPMQFSQCIKT